MNKIVCFVTVNTQKANACSPWTPWFYVSQNFIKQMRESCEKNHKS